MRAGLGTAVITPDLPAYLAGYGDRRAPATAVHDDLEAHVLVVEDGARRVALVTCDLLVMSHDVSTPIRTAVAEVAGTSTDAVLTSCTHVHAGPSALTGSEAIGWPVPDGYAARLVARVTDAARVAMGALTPVGARFDRTVLPPDVAINRRGHALVPEAHVFVLEPVAVVANFGIHPTVTGPSNLAVATDWVGPFRRALGDRTGMGAVFLQGCQGDVNPAVTAWDDGAPAAWEGVVEAFATRLAGAIAPAVARANTVTAAPITTTARTIRVPIGDTLLAQLAGRARERSIELVEWTLGAVRVCSVPGEGFHGVEAAVRAHRPGPLLLAGLAPDWHGYLPRPYTDGYEEGLSLGPDAVERVVAALAG
jgi:hypothetical protein